MHKNKTKIFLGAFLNVINAQNINCLSLAKHLDHDRFSVYALSLYSAPNVKTKARLFNCFYPFRLSSFFGFIWGILICDIIYFPKHHSTPKWMLILSNILGRKLFTTIENNMCDIDKISMINTFGGRKNLFNYFKHVPNIFGITKFIISNAKCGVKLEDQVLYLGVELDLFKYINRHNLINVVFVGSLKERKRVREFLKLANEFPKIKFNVIGDGIDSELLKFNASSNVIFFDHLEQDDLSFKFSKMDLLFLPSKSEGFPKVILEAAASGIPSIVYNDYGAQEWLCDNKNGFIVDNFVDVVDVINRLLNEDKLLSLVSNGAYNMSLDFDWKKQIKVWEKVIENLK